MEGDSKSADTLHGVPTSAVAIPCKYVTATESTPAKGVPALGGRVPALWGRAREVPGRHVSAIAVTATGFIPASSTAKGGIASAFSARGVSARVEGLMMERGEHVSAVTATESMPASSTAEGGIASAFSPTGVSARVEGLMKARSKYANEVEFEIEASKSHWSEVTDTIDDENGESDKEVFAGLQKTYGDFFRNLDNWVHMGEKIAEGGQAEIFKASNNGVLKVMKKGYRLQDLKKQWPPGMLHNLGFLGSYNNTGCCWIQGATLLKNGRFAFWMYRYWGDLRKLIDMRMQLNHNQCPPFIMKEVEYIVKNISHAMEQLHGLNIVHKDLKASNILISFKGKKLNLKSPDFERVVVADFECSVGVVGTGYWRAPEILQGVQQRDIKNESFTKKSDVYAFGMTCYEVLTGCIPFEELDGRCYDLVIEGRRPQLLENIDPRWKELLNKCWHGNPLERPSFIEIGEYLNELCSSN